MEKFNQWLDKKKFGLYRADLNKDSKLRSCLLKEIEAIEVNSGLCGFEKVKQWYFTLDVKITDLELFTPTFKMKRKAIRERYGAELDKLHEQIEQNTFCKK